jgi:3-oxoacyl-[acyl-carrier protein] reductase
LDVGLRGCNFVLAADGPNVALLARDADRAAEKAGRLSRQYDRRAVGIGVDAAAPGDDVDRAIGRSADALGPLRGLAIRGADETAGAVAGARRRVLRLVPPDDPDGTVRFLPRGHLHLQRNGGGTVVATAAYCVRPPKLPVPPYDALKAAMMTMSKVLAKTHGPEGIR